MKRCGRRAPSCCRPAAPPPPPRNESTPQSRSDRCVGVRGHTPSSTKNNSPPTACDGVVGLKFLGPGQGLREKPYKPYSRHHAHEHYRAAEGVRRRDGPNLQHPACP